MSVGCGRGRGKMAYHNFLSGIHRDEQSRYQTAETGTPGPRAGMKQVHTAA